MSGLSPSPPAATPTSAERYTAGQKATWLSAALNTLLTVAQIVVGFLANAQSLIAHGLHSFSDLLSDFLVLWANRQGSHPADDEHPYGHGRIETAATLVLGASLIAVGGGILLAAADKLQHVDDQPPVEWLALWVAIATAAGKEALFRYLRRVAEALRSPMLLANAWHTRADAASALVVVIGVGGALAGWPLLDLVGAAIMGFMILHMGGQLAYASLKELIDTGLDEERVQAIRQTLATSPGVLGVHDLRTRRMAHQALVDAHIRVDGRLSVSEGHRVGEMARQRVLEHYPEVMDVLIHIDVEDDIGALATPLATLPDRSECEERLRALIGAGQPEPERIVLHYLNGRIEAELHFAAANAVPAGLTLLGERLQAALVAESWLGGISLHVRAALRKNEGSSPVPAEGQDARSEFIAGDSPAAP